MSIESVFRRYFGKLSFGVILLDGANNFCDCNSEFQELLDSKEPAGASLIGLLAGEARAAATECSTEALHGAYVGMPVDAGLAGDTD